MNTGIVHRTIVPRGASVFVEPDRDGRIRPLVDLRFRNHETEANHILIPEQNTILNAGARRRIRTKLDLHSVSFHTRVQPDAMKYKTTKTPLGGLTCQVMIQGDMNAPGTFARTIEDVFHHELRKNI